MPKCDAGYIWRAYDGRGVAAPYGRNDAEPTINGAEGALSSLPGWLQQLAGGDPETDRCPRVRHVLTQHSVNGPTYGPLQPLLAKQEIFQGITANVFRTPSPPLIQDFCGVSFDISGCPLVRPLFV
jgi:hypothetical protein